jgi:threonine/homoserine/homoserine lactone efflux protein
MTGEFWVTTLVVVATPGTGAVYTIAAGLSRGTRAGILAAFACTLGIIPHVLAAVTGLAALLHASALAFEVVKYLGVGYLLYVAWRTWQDPTPLDADGEAPPGSPWRVIATGVLINLPNPKLTIFFFAFLPQFISRGEGTALPQMLLMSGAFMLVTFVVFVAYGLVAAAFRGRVLRRPGVLAWMRRGFAAMYFVLAVRLGLQER